MQKKLTMAVKSGILLLLILFSSLKRGVSSCDRIFAEDAKDAVNIHFESGNGNGFNFTTFVVYLPENLFVCPENEIKYLQLRVRKSLSLKRNARKIDVALNADSVKVEGVESCTAYKFYLKAKLYNKAADEINLGLIRSGPRIIGEIRSRRVNSTRILTEWTISDVCATGFTVSTAGLNADFDADARNATLTVNRCESGQTIGVSANFKPYRGLKREISVTSLPDKVEIAANCDRDGGITFNLAQMLECDIIVSAKASLMMKNALDEDYAELTSRSREYLQFERDVVIAFEDIKERMDADKMLGPCQRFVAELRLEMRTEENEHKASFVALTGLGYSTDENGTLRFDANLTEKCRRNEGQKQSRVGKDAFRIPTVEEHDEMLQNIEDTLLKLTPTVTTTTTTRTTTLLSDYNYHYEERDFAEVSYVDDNNNNNKHPGFQMDPTVMAFCVVAGIAALAALSFFALAAKRRMESNRARVGTKDASPEWEVQKALTMEHNHEEVEEPDVRTSIIRPPPSNRGSNNQTSV